ncbi:MAG: methyltransferase domain-containing protein [Planctomycetota bacterium]|nr:methyltransferase domain-containing protein [Planctomycetota bacterium]
MTTEYIFERQQADQERIRLQMIEEALDPATIARLQTTGLQSGARCLELGAGAGSIMKWMGSVVGASGRVVGVDRDTKHLQHLADPRFQISEGDFLDVTLDELFDLVHCRYVLIHNRSSVEILTKLCQQLKPGGYLVIEEPDFTSAKLLNRTRDAARQRVNNAICRMFENLGLNPGYGLELPQKVTGEGLQLIATDAQLHLARGGSPMGRMMAASQQALAEKLIATAEVIEAEIDEYVRDSQDIESWAVYYCTVSVVASKPT